MSLHDIGDVWRAQGEWAKAADFYRRAAERKAAAEEAGTPGDLAGTLLRLGEMELAAGDPTSAAEHGSEATNLLRREDKPDPERLAGAIALQGEALIKSGDPDSALVLLEEAATQARDIADAADSKLKGLLEDARQAQGEKS